MSWVAHVRFLQDLDQISVKKPKPTDSKKTRDKALEFLDEIMVPNAPKAPTETAPAQNFHALPQATHLPPPPTGSHYNPPKQKNSASLHVMERNANVIFTPPPQPTASLEPPVEQLDAVTLNPPVDVNPPPQNIPQESWNWGSFLSKGLETASKMAEETAKAVSSSEQVKNLMNVKPEIGKIGMQYSQIQHPRPRILKIGRNARRYNRASYCSKGFQPRIPGDQTQSLVLFRNRHRITHPTII